MHCLGGDSLSLVASLVAIAFSFTSSTGRWRQLSSPQAQPVHQVQAAAASQSGRLMLTASSSPIAGNTHRFQPSTAEVNYLPAQYISASTAITLQDQELYTVKPGQWWPKVGVFLRTPEPIYDADYISWLKRVGTIEAMGMSRPTASPELLKFFGSLFGALLHATTYRPEIMAALGLLGSCLSFQTQEMYAMHLVRVLLLVYLARTRSLGVTYSKHADDASKLRAFAGSNWAVTRSTTGYTRCIMLAGAGIGSVSRRQHCISMSSCEAELNALAECALELLHVSAMLTFIGPCLRRVPFATILMCTCGTSPLALWLCAGWG